MNGIQVTKPDERQCNRLLDAVVTILKYNKSTIDHAVYIKFFSGGTESYLTVSTDDFINATNNEKAFPELTRVFKHSEIKYQEGLVLKYLNVQTCQSPLGFIVDHTYHIMELVNECFPIGKFRKVDTPFRTYYAYEK